MKSNESIVDRCRDSFIELAQILSSHHYSTVIQTLSGGRLLEPWFVNDEKTNQLHEPLSSIVKFFYLGQPVKSIPDLLDSKLLHDLITLRLVRQHETSGQWQLQGYSIIPYHGLYIWAHVWKPNEVEHEDQVWFGKDSLLMSRIMPPLAGKKVLDLGSGNGILTLLAAMRNADVTATDILSRAVALTELNVIFNGFEHRTTVRQGNLFEPVQGQTFDCILVNAPFTPLMSKRSKLFQSNEHSQTGSQIFDQIIRQMNTYLRPSGAAYIVCGGFGNENRPDAAGELSKLSALHGWETTLFITEKMPAADRIRYMKKFNTSQDQNEEEIELPPDKTTYFSFLTIINRSGVCPGFSMITKLCKQYSIA